MPENHLSERQERLNKLAELEKLGISPYPALSRRNRMIGQLLDDFSRLEANQKKFRLAGRLRAIRGHGNLAFASLQDASGQIQLVLSKNELGAPTYKNFLKLIDVGDFLEISGSCFTTRRGEKSIMVSAWIILAKAIRPLPDKWHGLKDEEERLRKRYLELIFNPELRLMIERKTIFWNSIRQFLTRRGFVEVETPVLENTTGGADARPFVTHHNALNLDLYLRISMGELWQKRLLVGGLEKTFEIGRQFRNEGMDAEHLQDYTQMEFYWAYADYQDGMKLVEQLFKHTAKQTFNTLKFKIGQYQIDLDKPWQTYDYQQTVIKFTGLDILKTDLKQISARLKQLKIDFDQRGFNLTRAIDNLWKYCRKRIAGPGFVVNIPVAVSPLAKTLPDQPQLTQRFQVLIAGSELGNGYSELNNPLDQAARFIEQTKLRQAGDEEAQMYDREFIEALEYGMPPACGFGLSERVFSFFSDKPMREGQIFPLLKPKSATPKDNSLSTPTNK